MFKKPLNPFKYRKLKMENDSKSKNKQTSSYNDIKKDIPASIEAIKEDLQQIFAECSDFTTREITRGEKKQVAFLVTYIDGLVDQDLLDRDVVDRLLALETTAELPSTALLKQVVSSSHVKTENSFKNTVNSILSGDIIIFVEGETNALDVSLRNPPGRSVAEPDTEVTIRGPREGFVENLRVNSSLLRRKVKSPSFKLESMVIGEETKTEVAICYIKGLVHEEIVETVRRRLSRINTDAILESGYLEQFIEDGPYSIFPTVGNSEKPDKVAAKLLEGRVAILCDGTPFVLTVPYLLIETIQASEDYYEKPYFSSIVRVFRVLALIISSALPAIYVALVSFHQSIIPFKLLLTMSASREGIPFSPFVEALLMIITFELLREAGVRMPRTVGQTIGIVGAVVIGEAAVRAGIASAPMIIVISITAICSFITPPLIRVTTIIRFITLLAANVIGLLGIALVATVFLIDLCAQRSFGVPYLSPFAPFNGTDMKDAILRFPLWTLFTHPRVIMWDNPDKRYRMKVDYRKKED